MHVGIPNTEIRLRRLAAGLTLRDLAEEVGCSHQMIAAVERGLHPNSETAKKVLDALLRAEQERA